MSSANSTPTQIHAIAYHEAGHAVVAWFVGLEPYEISLIPAENYLGYVMNDPGCHMTDDMQHEPKPGDQERTMLAAMVSLAGPIAQLKYDPKSVLNIHGRSDRLSALRYAEWHCESEEECRAWERLCSIRVEQQLDTLWPAVQKLANTLIEHGLLKKDAIEAAIQSAMDSVKRLPKDRTCLGEIWPAIQPPA